MQSSPMMMNVTTSVEKMTGDVCYKKLPMMAKGGSVADKDMFECVDSSGDGVIDIGEMCAEYGCLDGKIISAPTSSMNGIDVRILFQTDMPDGISFDNFSDPQFGAAFFPPPPLSAASADNIYFQRVAAIVVMALIALF